MQALAKAVLYMNNTNKGALLSQKQGVVLDHPDFIK
jgi:hypothetical protein